MLDCVRQTRDDIAAADVRGRAAVDVVVRNFALDRKSRALSAVLEFIDAWE